MLDRITDSRPIRLALAFLLAFVAVISVGVYASRSETGRAHAAASAGTGTASAPRGWYIDVNGLPHLLPKRDNAVAGAGGDYKGMWYRGDTLDPVTAPPVGDSGTKIVHKTVTVNADYQAGTADERTVTFTGLPAYVSGGSAELSGSNNGGIPDGYAASIGVTQVPPTNGQTVRKFILTPAGFNGAESFTLDVWVIVTT